MEKIDEKIIEENLKQSVINKKNGVFFINSNFTDELLEYLFLDIEKAIKDKNIDKVKIYINSNGGSATTLFPLVDLIGKSEKSVETIVLGKAYSAGAFLLLSGTDGHRFAYENSDILLHEVASDGGYTKVSQAVENAKHSEIINKKIIDILKKKTKMTSNQIASYMFSNKDIFIDSKTALKYGVIDKII
jgi:ATP-dependent Clp protease, protease subunit